MSTCIENTPLQRKCTKCKEVKPLSKQYFSADKNRLYGLMYKCKQCEKQRKDRRSWEYRAGKMTAEQKAARKVTLAKYAKTLMGKAIALVAAYRTADQKKGLQCTITTADVLAVKQQFCIYCGDMATGFDRKDNSLGHTLENCVPSCKECNVGRMDNFTHEEMKVIGLAIAKVKAARKNSGKADKDGYVNI